MKVNTLKGYIPYNTEHLSHFYSGPPTIGDPDYLERYLAQEGDTVRLHCPIVGTPRPIIEWFQDEQMIVQPTWDRFRVSKRTLKIRDARVADSGVFVCKGVNGFGSETVALHLVVKGKHVINHPP